MSTNTKCALLRDAIIAMQDLHATNDEMYQEFYGDEFREHDDYIRDNRAYEIAIAAMCEQADKISGCDISEFDWPCRRNVLRPWNDKVERCSE